MRLSLSLLSALLAVAPLVRAVQNDTISGNTTVVVSSGSGLGNGTHFLNATTSTGPMNASSVLSVLSQTVTTTITVPTVSVLRKTSNGTASETITLSIPSSGTQLPPVRGANLTVTTSTSIGAPTVTPTVSVLHKTATAGDHITLSRSGAPPILGADPSTSTESGVAPTTTVSMLHKTSDGKDSVTLSIPVAAPSTETVSVPVNIRPPLINGGGAGSGEPTSTLTPLPSSSSSPAAQKKCDKNNARRRAGPSGSLGLTDGPKKMIKRIIPAPVPVRVEARELVRAEPASVQKGLMERHVVHRAMRSQHHT